MEEVLEIVEEIRRDCRDKQKNLAQQTGLSPTDEPLGVFGKCHNHSAMTLELLSYYYEKWGDATKEDLADGDVDRARQENAERIINLGQSLLIQCISAMEFGAKTAMTENPQVLGNPGTFGYSLNDVIEDSQAPFSIGADRIDRWEGVIYLRNIIVHNNGIAFETNTYRYPTFEIEMIGGTMTQGDITTLPRATRWSISAFSDWTQEFTNRL